MPEMEFSANAGVCFPITQLYIVAFSLHVFGFKITTTKKHTFDGENVFVCIFYAVSIFQAFAASEAHSLESKAFHKN